MNLCIDLGNSFMKTGLFEGNLLVGHKAFAADNPAGLKSLKEFLHDKPLKKAMLSSTRKDHGQVLNYLRKRNIPCTLLDHQTQLPFSITYQTRTSLGMDRVANAAGAQARFPGADILIIDIGTAITIDFFAADNVLTGGNISPGMDLRFKALHACTGNLPLLEKNKEMNPGLTSQSTHQAMESGVYYGILFELNGYIAAHRAASGKVKVLLTGGDAAFFEKNLKYTIFVVQNLSLEGLNRILIYNAS